MFWIIRYGASLSQDLQVSRVPRGARMVREGSLRVDMRGAVVRERHDYPSGRARMQAMRILAAFLLILLLTGAATASGHGSESKSSRLKPLPQERERMLVFTKTTGWRHDSIPVATDTLRALGTELNWQVEHGEDAGAFTAQNLARYRLWCSRIRPAMC